MDHGSCCSSRIYDQNPVPDQQSSAKPCGVRASYFTRDGILTTFHRGRSTSIGPTPTSEFWYLNNHLPLHALRGVSSTDSRGLFVRGVVPCGALHRLVVRVVGDPFLNPCRPHLRGRYWGDGEWGAPLGRRCRWGTGLRSCKETIPLLP